MASGRQLDAAQPTSGGEGDADEDDDDDARGADDGEEKDMKQLLVRTQGVWFGFG